LMTAHSVGDRQQETCLTGKVTARQRRQLGNVDGIFVFRTAADIGRVTDRNVQLIFEDLLCRKSFSQGRTIYLCSNAPAGGRS
jgi:hypothetical protein